MQETISPLQGLGPVGIPQRWAKTHRCAMSPRWGLVVVTPEECPSILSGVSQKPAPYYVPAGLGSHCRIETMGQSRNAAGPSLCYVALPPAGRPAGAIPLSTDRPVLKRVYKSEVMFEWPIPNCRVVEAIRAFKAV